ncbi:MAG: hypothetical protein Q7R98_01670 [Candidatus Jorgensenbacteria bacterium]|nr:hypothetical protein [Candidatus Jorgensenbacteria bacterium]
MEKVNMGFSKLLKLLTMTDCKKDIEKFKEEMLILGLSIEFICNPTVLSELTIDGSGNNPEIDRGSINSSDLDDRILPCITLGSAEKIQKFLEENHADGALVLSGLINGNRYDGYIFSITIQPYKLIRQGGKDS